MSHAQKFHCSPLVRQLGNQASGNSPYPNDSICLFPLVCLPLLATVVPFCGYSSQAWFSIPLSVFRTAPTTLENPVYLSISLSTGSVTKYCKLGNFFFSEHLLVLAVWKAGSLSKELRSSGDSSSSRPLISYEILTRKKMDSQYSSQQATKPVP